jgi:hypothetical protein
MEYLLMLLLDWHGFFFGLQSLNILQGIIVIINYIVLIKLFKSEKWVCVLTVLNLFFTFYDAYVAAFSNCLFWITIYGHHKKKKWWPIPLLIAAYNHPYVLISSIYFAIKNPSLIIPESLILTWFMIATAAFSSDTFFPIYTIFMGLARIVMNLLPILLLTKLGKANDNEFKILRDLMKYHVSFPTLLISLMILGLLAVNLTIYTLVMQPSNEVDLSMFEGIPNVDGTVRVVDYLYLPSVYVLPYQGFTLDAGSFRENNPQHMIKLLWDNSTDYLNAMHESNITYVLFCKMCNPQSNEKEILENNFSLIWENEYYYLYNVN